jgi:hypothetical protein
MTYHKILRRHVILPAEDNSTNPPRRANINKTRTFILDDAKKKLEKLQINC